MSLKGSIKALVAARPAYDEAKAFFEGEVDEVIASQKLRKLLGDQGKHFRVNHARTPVDVMLERTEITAITSENDNARTVCNQAWEDNQLGLEAKDIHRRAYEFGDAYLIGWSDEELPGGVSFYAHDPQEVRVFYDPQRPRVKSHAIHTWLMDSPTDESGGSYRVNVYYPDRVEQYISANEVTRPDGSKIKSIQECEWGYYVTEDSDEQGVVENPWGVIPVFHFRTDRPYGRPEHKDAYGPQNIINKTWTTLMGSVDYHGFPQRYIQTDDAVNAAPENLTPDQAMNGDATPDAQSDFDPAYLTPTGPSELWLLSGKNIKVGEFDPPEAKPLLDVIESALKQMSSVTDIPAARFDRSGDTPSGESYRMQDAPLNNKVTDREAQFSVTWREALQFVLLVNDVDAIADVVWAPPADYTDHDSWETANEQIDAGVPAAQVLRERAYRQEDIEKWGVTEQSARTDDSPVRVTQPETRDTSGANLPANA